MCLLRRKVATAHMSCTVSCIEIAQRYINRSGRMEGGGGIYINDLIDSGEVG